MVRRRSRPTAILGILAIVAPVTVTGGHTAASAAAIAVHPPMIPTPGVAPSVSNVASTNWSGYSAEGASFTSVSASWTEPSVICGSDPNSYAAFWVGLDGYANDTVEQTGTDSDCDGTTPTYYAWYEMYPAPRVEFSKPEAPGDNMKASVTKSGTTFTMTIEDVTRGWTKTVVKSSANAKGASAEVITEALSSTTVLPLADFGKVHYTDATIDGSSLSAVGAIPLTMEKNGHIDSATSVLTKLGHKFSNIWKHE